MICVPNITQILLAIGTSALIAVSTISQIPMTIGMQQDHERSGMKIIGRTLFEHMLLIDFVQQIHEQSGMKMGHRKVCEDIEQYVG